MCPSRRERHEKLSEEFVKPWHKYPPKEGALVLNCKIAGVCRVCYHGDIMRWATEYTSGSLQVTCMFVHIQQGEFTENKSWLQSLIWGKKKQ